MPFTLTQTLAISALVAVNESLIDSGRLEPAEVRSLEKILAMVKGRMEPELPLPSVMTSPPVMILASDEEMEDAEFEAAIHRIAQEVAAP
jgi:hypothetical protein